MNVRYEAPRLTLLGSVAQLTQSGHTTPPGKSPTDHDGSGFTDNFSCVADQTPGSNCAGGAPVHGQP